ncbi:SpdA protein [Planomonospora parontospora subsp. parontospora]|uniref:SpdA protein n=2 Tax=Planomonospora parontospora TaxID=58119 RepID=A0AA37BFA0_9ACTN|nr:DUF2637 domain-containing protein [Planomonospora parontospora]GGK62747.1 SpdA protein [Planomonospora parontospora]GII08297.1 SpdA protein [Planomonospora parontospora subsp. parontospora]
MRRLASWLLDSGPVLVLALIAGAGSFSHIRQTAVEHGQTGWMAWAVAVCVDLTCVMAARERQRDKKTGRERTGPLSWPTFVLVAGIVLSLAANLHQAEPSVWGWLTAGTPAAAFLVAVSMLERRAAAPRPRLSPEPSPMTAAAPSAPAIAPAVDEHQNGAPGPAPALLDYARRIVDEHHAKHGKPITCDLLRARLGVSDQLASDLLRHLRTVPDAL